MTDEILCNAFREYPSFLKGRVIRNKRTNKTKGFGFLSFAKQEDYIQAYRDMNGKYVGNRPIRMKPSNWKDQLFKDKHLNGKKYELVVVEVFHNKVVLKWNEYTLTVRMAKLDNVK